MTGLSVGTRYAFVLMGLSLAGCGGGGGGGGSGGTSLNNAPPAKPGNALLQHVSATANGATIDGRSPSKGSNVAITSTGNWTVTPMGPNSSLPSDVPGVVAYDYVNTPPGYDLYQRHVTIHVSGGTGGLGASTVSGTEYVTCQSVPSNNGCGDQKVLLWSNGAFQDAAMQVNTTTQNGHSATTHQTTFSQINSLTEITGQGALEHSFVGEYGDATISGTLTGGVFTPKSGTATIGYVFGGDATSAGDMSALKGSANPTATYNGAFIGNAGSISNGGSGVFGDVALTADFGGGTISGNVSNMDVIDPNTSTIIAAGYGLAMNGTIQGSAYSGTTTYSDGTGTGQLVGGFFGAGAAETTGVVQVQGAQPTGGTCVTADCFLQGAFGAKKQ
jgi:hypothetical protein